jgi:carbamate kinase
MTSERGEPAAKPLALVAVGGNALVGPGERVGVATQRRNLERVAPALVSLSHTYRLVVTHGNGPQVGQLAEQAPAADLALDVFDARSAGEIGYLLCEALDAAGAARTVTVITRVEVAFDDPAFAEPTKPIGPLMSVAQADALGAARGWRFVARGAQMRRVVPSPEPRAIVEVDLIRSLTNQDAVVVCAGGGGIPVSAGGVARRGVYADVD